jgi:hypothetical protein
MRKEQPLFSSSDLLHQLVTDRQQELLESAAAGRNARPSAVRRFVARSLRRVADRLDEAVASPGLVDATTPDAASRVRGLSAS